MYGEHWVNRWKRLTGKSPKNPDKIPRGKTKATYGSNFSSIREDARSKESQKYRSPKNGQD